MMSCPLDAVLAFWLMAAEDTDRADSREPYDAPAIYDHAVTADDQDSARPLTNTSTGPQRAHHAVVELEVRLLDPQVRGDASAIEALLHPDFTEFGASGRVYDRASIIAAVVKSDDPSAHPFEFRAVSLADDVVLLTYRTEPPSLRTSIWKRDDDRWRILHHRGTAVPRDYSE